MTADIADGDEVDVLGGLLVSAVSTDVRLDDKLHGLSGVLADALGLDVAEIHDGLAYRSIAAWDSLSHVALMVRLESAYGIEIPAVDVPGLSSVAAIREYLRIALDRGPSDAAAPQFQWYPAPSEQRLHRGLAGVHVDSSAVSAVNGEEGELLYRGYPIGELARHASYEEVVYVLLYGELPSAAQLDELDRTLRASRGVPHLVQPVLQTLSAARPVEALRTAVSALSCWDPAPSDGSPEAERRQAIRLIAQIPTLIAAHHALRRGETPVEPDPSLGHAANFLQMLTGRPPTPGAAEILDKVLILHADHSANASAFVARVATSTTAGVHAAVTAALATFEGSLHGGAIEGVMQLVRAIGRPENAAAYVADLQRRNQPVMGFGHRVYRTADPRSVPLREIAVELAAATGSTQDVATLDAVVDAMQPFARKGVGVNVDFYAGLIYKLIGIPDDLFVSAFAAGRAAGWVTQILEQRENNILIRPLLAYHGPQRRPYVALAERSA